jgi:serine/threonine-protein kinase
MGTVWVARLDGSFGMEKLVALKMIAPDLAADLHFRRMFIDEARVASRVSHPNVAGVLDFGEAYGALFYAMEWVDGESLRELQRACTSAGERVPAGVAARILADACVGLHAAHEATDLDGTPLEVVHRDVSPHNILLTTDGIPRLIDFGIARARARLADETSAGHLKGKTEYLAPEQARGGRIDRRTDVWAAGAVLYQLVAGRAVYPGATREEAVQHLLSGKPPDPLGADVPPAIASIVMRALSMSPEGRYATALEMARALDRALLDCGTPTTQADVAAFAAPRLATARAQRRIAIASALARTRETRQTAIPPDEGSTGEIARDPREGGVVASLRAERLTPSHGTLGSGMQRPAPPPRRAPVYRRIAAAAALVVVALGTSAWTRLAHLRSPDAAPAVAPAATSLLDPPAAGATSREAELALRGAMQMLCDASLEMAHARFEDVLKLDPNLPAAHLRIALMQSSWRYRPLKALREHVAAATQYRRALGEGDGAVLDALQPEVESDALDAAAAWTRWRVLVDRFPLDVEVLLFAAERADRAGDSASGMALLERATSLDKRCALPWEKRAAALLRAGDADGVLAATDRCLALSPSAATCLRRRAAVEAWRGDCAQVEQDARRMTAMEPEGGLAAHWLERALVSRGAPLESIDLANRRYLDLVHDADDRTFAELVAPALVDWLRGDFAAIVPRFAAWERVWQNAPNETIPNRVAQVELTILAEAGEPARAIALADDYRKRLPAMVPDSPSGARPMVLALERRAGHVSAAQFRAAQAEALAQMRGADFAGDRLFFLASTAQTGDDAREALAETPNLPRELYPNIESRELAIARLYRMADRPDEALAHLRRAAAYCYGPWNLAFHLRASQELGEMLEAQGDRAGACAAWSEVIAHWGNARPRSQTANAARAGILRLNCSQ